ncbi:hypothetical protein HDU67_009327 [Dinochytrium kinnereticum]|nr:hypothetical protein HDU67_009327 [Dinochytrium kinnereticum]
MVLTEIELTGNEIPDDVLRSITIALERNRDRFKHLLQNKIHSEHLSNTLQALTTAHQSNLEQLSSKLSASDVRAHGLSDKLSVTSRELTEALEYRRSADAKIRELNSALDHERRESSTRLSELQNEVFKEKEKRLKLEDQISLTNATTNGRLLELEANLRETEMKAEVLRRDKIILLEEMDKAKEREKALNELHKEKIAKIEATHSHRIATLTEAREVEALEKSRRFEEKLRNAQAEKQKVEEEFDALKAKTISEKRQLMDKMAESEMRQKKEEETRRKDLETLLESTRQSRDKLQSDLTSLQTAKAALLRDHQTEVKRLTDQKVEMSQEIGDLRTTHAKLLSEVTGLRRQVEEASKVNQGLSDKVLGLQRKLEERAEDVAKCKVEMKAGEERFVQVISQKDGVIGRLKDQIRRLENELDDEHESQSLRMKDLALQINNLLADRHRRMRNRSPEPAQ